MATSQISGFVSQSQFRGAAVTADSVTRRVHSPCHETVMKSLTIHKSARRSLKPEPPEACSPKPVACSLSILACMRSAVLALTVVTLAPVPGPTARAVPVLVAALQVSGASQSAAQASAQERHIFAQYIAWCTASPSGWLMWPPTSG